MHAFNSVNLKLVHTILEISSPREVIHEKKFDAVEFQRKIREELGNEYLSDRERFLCELEEKYSDLQKQQIGTHVE